MKCLQIIIVASALALSAAAAHASTSASDSTHADALMSNAYAQQDAPQSGIRHAGSRNSDDSSGSSAHSDAGTDTSAHLPATNGKTPDPGPAENARAPSWQSLLPGSIQ